MSGNVARRFIVLDMSFADQRLYSSIGKTSSVLGREYLWVKKFCYKEVRIAKIVVSLGSHRPELAATICSYSNGFRAKFYASCQPPQILNTQFLLNHVFRAAIRGSQRKLLGSCVSLYEYACGCSST